MTRETARLEPGLYFVATPIGSARDITLRALDILRGADVIAAEDTRTARKLMEIHGIKLGDRPLLAYHDHNGPAVRPKLLGMIKAGKSVAYASEAGTPLVADPGFALARAAIEAGHRITAAPGPSALLAALTVSGLPTDRFLFAGFPPSSAGARRTFFADLKNVPATLVFYESPKRVSRMLKDAADILGPERQAAVCRELTKRFEETRRGRLDDLVRQFQDRAVKGELVVVIDRSHRTATPEDIDMALTRALETMSVKDAATTVATALGLPRRGVYQAALALSEGR